MILSVSCVILERGLVKGTLMKLRQVCHKITAFKRFKHVSIFLLRDNIMIVVISTSMCIFMASTYIDDINNFNRRLIL